MKDIILLLCFIFTISKEIKNISLAFQKLNLSNEYDYSLYKKVKYIGPQIFYFYIGTELEIFPCDISYSFSGLNDTWKNISIYHQEKKGYFTTFFFNVEKLIEKETTLYFNITNIKGEETFLKHTVNEDLNLYYYRIENIKEPNTIRLYKNKIIYILFSTEHIFQHSFQINVQTLNVSKKQVYIGASKKEMNELIFIENYIIYEFWNVIYDNNTYELYPSGNPLAQINKDYKIGFIYFESLIDANVTLQFKNISNSPFIDTPHFQWEIGKEIWHSFAFEKLIYVINCSNYYQDLFYFTITWFDSKYKYYYSYGFDNEEDIPYYIELKNVVSKTKNSYLFCEMNRTSLDQKYFYFIIQGETTLLNYIIFRTTFFDEFNYRIQEPYKSYEFQIDKEHPNFPMVIGNFPYNEKIYFELEVIFPENNTNIDNNIKNTNIYVKIENINADSYNTFPLETKEVKLTNKITTEAKSYYLYESNNRFSSGVKSLFFFVNPKVRYPNCFIKYGAYKQKPVKYGKNIIYLNEEKIFNNTYDIFFLSANLTNALWVSNDNLFIIFEGKKDGFISDSINYRYGINKEDYSINGNYSLCNSEIKENGENKTIKCFIPEKSKLPLNLVLYLNKDFEIKVKIELVYIGNFVDELSLYLNKKYIILNNATNINNYIFISSNNDFNIDDISFNVINSLENFSESFPLNDSKKVKSFIDKRIYVNIENKVNKNFIGFKIGKMPIPFKIIKTKIDESKTHIIDFNSKYKFNLTKNEPLLFVTNFGPKYGHINLKIKSDVGLSYFQNLTYFCNVREFQSFSKINTMYKFDDNVYMMFYSENKTIIYKYIDIYNTNSNKFGMIITHKMEGEIELEILNDFYEISQPRLYDNIPFDLENRINIIDSGYQIYPEYTFILKHYNNITSDNFEIYYTNDYPHSTIEMNNIIPNDIKKDKNYTYYFFNFNYRPYLIVFCSNNSKINIRHSIKKENDVIKYYDFNEKKIEINNTNKIVLISGINITDIYRDKYYFKYTLDYKYYNNLKTLWYIDDEGDLDNIVDFYKREKSNIKLLKYLKYDNKLDIYLESYNLQSLGNKSAILMFYYYNNNLSLTIDLSLSKKLLYTSNNLLKSQNKTYEIINKVFIINLTLSDFKDDNNYIQFEIKGNSSAFNSTQMYINTYERPQYSFFDNYSNCNETNNNSEITLFCNYTKSSDNIALFMLLLNEGNKINIRNIISEITEIPDESNKTTALEYFCYIGIPVIVLFLGIVVVIIIIKRRKKYRSIDESITGLTGELSPKTD